MNLLPVLLLFVLTLKHVGILAPDPGTEPPPPALEGEILTIGLRGKSRVWKVFIGQPGGGSRQFLPSSWPEFGPMIILLRKKSS